jgi:hypothetical protein
MHDRRKRIHHCVDRVVPFEAEEEVRRIALEENPQNVPEPTGGRIAVERKKLWRPGRTLEIRFMDGSETQRRRVVEHALEWTRHANLRFDFGDHEHAQIRVSFTFEPGGAWSAVGTDALHRPTFPLHEPTMCLGWLEDETDDNEYSRVVLHEFGHAIGCIHEHQTPLGGMKWNKEAVYAFYAGPPNRWSREDVDDQVLDKYAKSQILGTAFDPDSIMLYEFPAELLLDGKATHENNKLSAKDIELIRSVYPFDR